MLRECLVPPDPRRRRLQECETLSPELIPELSCRILKLRVQLQNKLSNPIEYWPI